MKKYKIQTIFLVIVVVVLLSIFGMLPKADSLVNSEVSTLKSITEYNVTVTAIPSSDFTSYSVHDESIPLSPELQDHTLTMCEEYGIDSAIFFSLMYHESHYQVDAFNGADYGLCQINEVNWKWLKEDYNLDIKNEYDNIEAGALMLSLYLNKANGDYAHALTGYNTGSVKYVNGYARKVLNYA